MDAVVLISLSIQSRSDALWDLESFVQLKKREKHQRRSVNFSKVTG